MKHLKQVNEVRLGLSVYRKANDRASLVFRRKGVLFRLTTVLRADRLIQELHGYAEDLAKGQAEPCYLCQIGGPGNKNWVLEVGLTGDAAALSVFESRNGNSLLKRFGWKAGVNELQLAFSKL